MTDFQKAVLNSISSFKTDEHKTVAAIHQVAMWYYNQGNVHTAWEIVVENPVRPLFD